MIFDTLPGIYAKALLDLTEKDYEAAEQEFSDVVRVFLADEKTELFFRSPVISPQIKVNVIEKSFRGKASPVIVNFLSVMARRNRLSEIQKVYEVYRYYVSEKLGRKTVSVVTAISADSAMKAGIEKSLQAHFQSRLDIRYEVRPELLGGIVIRYEGREIDVSVLRSIRRIRQQMLASKFSGEKLYEN